METIHATEAIKLIRRHNAPEGMRVKGHLKVSGHDELEGLPNGLEVTRLTIRECPGPVRLPAGLRCFDLDAAQQGGLTMLPADLRVESRLDLSGCLDLTHLPDALRVGTLRLSGCTRLTRLPENLDVQFLDISGCTSLTAWPRNASLRNGHVIARDCTGLRNLPDYLGVLAQLDVSGCTGLQNLPDGLRVTSWLDIARTGISDLPVSLRGARLRWRGVLVEERIVFRPETITSAEVLAAANVEVRRTMMERMGLERFFADAQARIVDTDRDPGGERRLLCMPLPGDEDLVCLSVTCPSTGRHYVLRVPPTTGTCRQAAAWIAGFDNPDDYRPLLET